MKRIGWIVGVLLIAIAAFLVGRRSVPQTSAAPPAAAVDASTPRRAAIAARKNGAGTRIHAHNLLLKKGPKLGIYVRWLSGQLVRNSRTVNPSFDHPDSFDLGIDDGIIRINIGDIGYFINSSLTDAPLKNIKLLADGPKLKLTGTLHKLVPLPVQVGATLAAAPDNKVSIHVESIKVLKVPVKGLLSFFRVSTADLVKTTVPGVTVQGNDIVVDARQLLPPPHIVGRLTAIRVDSPDIEAVFGSAAEQAVEKVELWRNFVSLKGGNIDFGKLTMNDVDLLMVDISKDPWFELDLANYRAQFASGYTRITPQSGLQIFMPDLRDLPPHPVPVSDDIAWFKNRSIPPPPQIMQKIH